MEGVGPFWCIDPAGKEGDISPELVTDASRRPRRRRGPTRIAGLVWHYGGDETRPYARRDYVFGRTMSTACIVDDIVYIAELAGYVQCLDARTGKGTGSGTPSPTSGGRATTRTEGDLANEDGDLYIFKHDRGPGGAGRGRRGVERRGRGRAEGARPGVDDEGSAQGGPRRARHGRGGRPGAGEGPGTCFAGSRSGGLSAARPCVVGDTLYLATENDAVRDQGEAR